MASSIATDDGAPAAAPGPSETPPRNRPFRRLAVSRVDKLTDDAVAVTFDVPEEYRDEFVFRPGQFLTLRRDVDGRDERRSYSICAPVGAAPRIGVREVADGLFSTMLVNQVSAGDVLEVQAPTGNFTADPLTGGRHVLIAAGSGITPVLSIASSLLEASDDAEVVLIYGNRRTQTVMFTEDIADLKNAHPERFQVIHVLSREPRDVELFSGRLDTDKLAQLLTDLVPAEHVDHFWLCGPFEMVVGAREVLSGRGVGKDRIHMELFYVESAPPPVRGHEEKGIEGPASEVTVVFEGRTSTQTLPRDTPILDAAQQYRDDLPYACKGGVCGTCRAKLTCGTAEMHVNYALEDSEVEAGFILTCQARPTSDEVTVDFDR